MKKELKHLYNPSVKEIVIIDVPKMNFLMIDGSGDPNTSQEYKDAVEALYSLSYSLKFMIKKTQGMDYTVMPWKVCGGLMICPNSALKTRTRGNGGV